MTEYAPNVWPPRAIGSMFKGDMTPAPVVRKEKKATNGTAKADREQKQRSIRNAEASNKAKVRGRDGKAVCRLFGAACQHSAGPFETAHIDGKGMGGDHGIRSTTANMLRACHQHHQGRRSLHSKHLRVEFLTPKKADGPIRVWQRESTDSKDWTIVRSEGKAA